ncbi:MAG: hypothetical protein KC594_18400 [Nitrospira sp.]|nr:hypothetical protein [Nitrospira sp.]
MKTHSLILGLVACFVLAGNGAVFSQEAESMSEERGPGRLEKMDTDGDGKVSLDEFLEGAGTRFGKLDADEDGFLTAEEFKEGRKAIRAKGRERHEQRQGEKVAE